jgi:hypothetical protein
MPIFAHLLGEQRRDQVDDQDAGGEQGQDSERTPG